jgi:hypothetical protein
MQEDDQRQTESAGALKGLFSWSLPEGDGSVLQQISDCDPLSHSEGTARGVSAENLWRIAPEMALLSSTAKSGCAAKGYSAITSGKNLVVSLICGNLVALEFAVECGAADS